MILLVAAIALGRQGSPEFTDVFVSGEGFASIRIPSLVVTKKRTVLAFAEGRAKATDQAKNKIILRRSLDLGKTWAATTVVADDGSNSLNNPCTVVDQSSGRIFLMYQRVPSGMAEGSAEIADGYDGPSVYRCYLTWSDDDGVNWAKAVDVTRSVKRPTGVKTIAGGPGIGIQLTRGRHSGRLIMPFNEGPFWQWGNYAVYSDDHGKSWRYGERVPGALVSVKAGKPKSQINEVQMAELTDGSVLLNSRQFAGAAVRKSAVSRDGGETWSAVEDVPELRDPSCMGSILRYSFAGRGTKNILLYSGPDSSKRENGTVYASHDDGKTWPVKRTLWKGPFAYSVLTRLPDGSIGCLFEADEYKRIVFARFDLKWVQGR